MENNTLRQSIVALNRLLSDIYGHETRISSLLKAGSLGQEHLQELKKPENLSTFVDLFIFSLQIKLSTGYIAGERLFYILNERYGLSGKKTRTLQDISDEFGLSRERIRQLEEKAVKKLKRTKNDTFLEIVAITIANKVLSIHEPYYDILLHENESDSDKLE